jgi:hypothetical protein
MLRLRRRPWLVDGLLLVVEGHHPSLDSGPTADPIVPSVQRWHLIPGQVSADGAGDCECSDVGDGKTGPANELVVDQEALRGRCPVCLDGAGYRARVWNSCEPGPPNPREPIYSLPRVGLDPDGWLMRIPRNQTTKTLSGVHGSRQRASDTLGTSLTNGEPCLNLYCPLDWRWRMGATNSSRSVPDKLVD